jgi:hypothetical protein
MNDSYIDYVIYLEKNMSRSFGNFLARKQNQEFTYQFSRLCESIARSGVRWDDYCRQQLYPTLAEGNYQSPDELLALLNEAPATRGILNPMRYIRGKTYDDGKPAPAPAPPESPSDANGKYNWRDLGYTDPGQMSKAGPEDRKRRQAQFDAKKNGAPGPTWIPNPTEGGDDDFSDIGDPHAPAPAPGRRSSVPGTAPGDLFGPSTTEKPAAPAPGAKKGKGGVDQGRLDQETKLYQAAAQSIQGRFQQALQQFYNMVRDDAHANNNPHQYEVLRHFMKKIEPAYQKALTGLKAKASSGNEMRDIFTGASKRSYDQRQADSAARSGVTPTDKGVDIGRGPGGEVTRATFGTAAGQYAPEDATKFGATSYGDGSGGQAMSPEDMAKFGSSSAMVGGDGSAGYNPYTAQASAGDSAKPLQVPDPSAGVGDAGGTATDDQMPPGLKGVPPVGTDVSPDTKQAVNAQSGGYAGKPDKSGQFGADDGGMPDWSDDDIRPGAAKRSSGNQKGDWDASREDLDKAEKERRAMISPHSESYNPYKKLNYRRYR